MIKFILILFNSIQFDIIKFNLRPSVAQLSFYFQYFPCFSASAYIVIEVEELGGRQVEGQLGREMGRHVVGRQLGRQAGRIIGRYARRDLH